MSSQLSSSDLEFIDARMRKFSQDFDSLIDRFAADYIQVQSPEKPKGLFDIPITHKTIRDIIAEIERNQSFEYFLDVCLEVFWNRLELCLSNVHTVIDIEIKSELTQLFAVLRSDLKRLAGEYNISELDVAILTAQTRAQQALEQVKNWFRLANVRSEREFSFEELVDIGVECVTNIHPDFSPSVDIAFSHETFPPFRQLTMFSDIFFIVFDNI